MRTAVDTVVLLDVLLPDPRHGPASRMALSDAYDAGVLLACDVVFAELRAHFASSAAFGKAVDTLGLAYDPVEAETAALAGELWRAHRRAGGRRERLVADFLIGAHAARQAHRLLTRDRGFYRGSFSRLKIVEP